MHKPLPNATLLRELLSYDPLTGAFVWKQRGVNHFKPTMQRTQEWLCKWWNTRFAGTNAGSYDPNGYILIRINGIDYRAHRIAWAMTYGAAPEFIDHINGVRDDNRIENLRSIAQEGNAKNAKKRGDNRSGTTGVGFYPSKNKWRARINYKGKTIALGYFDTTEEAIAARKAAEKVYEYHENHGR